MDQLCTHMRFFKVWTKKVIKYRRLMETFIIPPNKIHAQLIIRAYFFFF